MLLRITFPALVDLAWSVTEGVRGIRAELRAAGFNPPADQLPLPSLASADDRWMATREADTFKAKYFRRACMALSDLDKTAARRMLRDLADTGVSRARASLAQFIVSMVWTSYAVSNGDGKPRPLANSAQQLSDAYSALYGTRFGTGPDAVDGCIAALCEAGVLTYAAPAWRDGEDESGERKRMRAPRELVPGPLLFGVMAETIERQWRRVKRADEQERTRQRAERSLLRRKAGSSPSASPRNDVTGPPGSSKGHRACPADVRSGP